MVANILVNWLISIGKKREKANYNIKKSYFPLKITAYSIAAIRMAKKLANMIKKYLFLCLLKNLIKNHKLLYIY